MKSNIATFKDVVCGMVIEADDISVDYQGCHYAFCSNQCLERFQLNPHLYIGYPGSKAPKQEGAEVLKKRTLQLSETLPQEVADRVIEYIQSMMGICSVEVRGDRIVIVYDLLQATESQIENTISKAGVVLGESLTEKIRRAFVHYMEETEVESLEARPGARRHCHY